MTVLFDKKSDSGASAPFRVAKQVTVFATGLLPGDEIQFETLSYAEMEPDKDCCTSTCDPCLPVGTKLITGAVRLRCCGCSCDSPQAEYPVRLTAETPFIVLDAPQNVDLRAVYIGGNLGDFSVWYENTATDNVTDAMRGCCNPPKVDVAVDKTVTSASPRVGESVTYTLLVTNAGPFGANKTVVVDDIPAAMTVTSINAIYGGGAAGAATLTRSQLAAGYEIPILPPNGSVVISVTGSFAEVGAVLNRSEVFAPPGTVDTNEANNGSEVLVNVRANEVDLVLTKTLTPAAPDVGQTCTYTINVGNSGPQSAGGAVVTDTLPVGFAMASGTITYSAGAAGPSTVTASGLAAGVVLPTLPLGGAATFTITGAFTAPGSHTNQATVLPPHGRVEVNPTDNTGFVVATVALPKADLAIEKHSLPTSPTVGDLVVWTVVATNVGPSTALGATLRDMPPDGLVFGAVAYTYTGGASGPVSSSMSDLSDGSIQIDLPVGSSVTATYSSTIPQALSGQLLINQAVVVPPPTVTDPNPLNNTAVNTVVVAPPCAQDPLSAVFQTPPINVLGPTGLFQTSFTNPNNCKSMNVLLTVHGNTDYHIAAVQRDTHYLIGIGTSAFVAPSQPSTHYHTEHTNTAASTFLNPNFGTSSRATHSRVVTLLPGETIYVSASCVAQSGYLTEVTNLMSATFFGSVV